MKLTQKHLFKGRREFEIADDYVTVRSKLPFKDEETITVMLTVLNPEPVISHSSLDFTSRVNGEPLLSLFLGKPNAHEFNAFVVALKQKAVEEFHAFAGLKSTNRPAGLEANVYSEPAEFSGSDPIRPVAQIRKGLDPDRILESIQMLNLHLKREDVAPLLAALEQLRAEPNSEALQLAVVNAFQELGPTQGAVLTYAPYVGILMSDGPIGAPY